MNNIFRHSKKKLIVWRVRRKRSKQNEEAEEIPFHIFSATAFWSSLNSPTTHSSKADSPSDRPSVGGVAGTARLGLSGGLAGSLGLGLGWDATQMAAKPNILSQIEEEGSIEYYE